MTTTTKIWYVGNREGSRASAMQRGQGEHCEVCGSHLDGDAGRGRAAACRTKRVVRLVSLCMLLLTGAVSYAIVNGHPVPQIIGQIVTVMIRHVGYAMMPQIPPHNTHDADSIIEALHRGHHRGHQSKPGHWHFVHAKCVFPGHAHACTLAFAGNAKPLRKLPK